MKIEFSSQRRETLLFLTINKRGGLMNGLKNAFQNKQHSSADGTIRFAFTGF